MSTLPSPRAQQVRQTRNSIAHLPSAELGGDKENATMDSAALSSLTAQSKDKAKRSRSKSIGPGGLDALKEGSGNNRKSLLPPRQVKSILKPTIALSPPKSIPPRSANRTPSPGKPFEKKTGLKSPSKSPSKKSPGKEVFNLQKPSNGSPKDSSSPSRSPTRVALRTEQEQEDAAREREKQEVLAHKEARRKSLAARRVSFAPEATLHTWNVVELPEDSTTSSASTNSTRRASGLTANAGSPYATAGSHMSSSNVSEPPSTPPEQVEELQVAASPAPQRDLHQKKRRRSSAIPPMNFNDPNEFSSSPASAQSDDTSTQGFETADEGIDSSDSDDDKDLVEDETVDVDGDDTTIQSMGGNSTGSSGRLEAALQQAAHQAGTQGIDYDEHGDITMEMANDEVTDAFQTFIKNGEYLPQVVGHPSALQDQENLNPFSPAFKANVREEDDEERNAAMEITQSVGSILPMPADAQASPKRRKRKSIVGGRRRSSVARRRSSGDGSAMGGDETMELTMAIGGIQQGHANGQEHVDQDSANEDEELTMEFTSVIGGVVQPDSKDKQSPQRVNMDTTLNEEDMDMTFAAGGILPSITETTEPLDDATMEVTTAIGAILPKQLSTGNKAEAKHLMELETDAGQLTASPFHDGSPQKPVGAGITDERPLPTHMHKATLASETGSPSIATLQTRSAGRKSLVGRHSMSLKMVDKLPTPVKKPGTPTQMTPHIAPPTTPGKTPPSKNVVMRTSSPKKLFKSEILASAKKENSEIPKSDFKHPLFTKDAITGTTTPSIILRPHKRRSSGLGVDREGLGSPRVTGLLDRRASIGDTAKAFVPHGNGASGVHFQNPQTLEQEIDEERAEDQRRESGRDILEAEADGQYQKTDNDATANLKDMIDSLTPQKNKLKGRKSLHIGAARGLLGKRPAELDDDEDEDATPKRLKGRDGSPVKKVKLPAPPPKSVTTGRITRSKRLSITDNADNARTSTPSAILSPSKNNTTPKDQSRFKDTESQSSKKVQSFEQKLAGETEGIEYTEEDDRIHLQEFLNMTSIRFMELTTTKRRHTVAPSAMGEMSAKQAGQGGNVTGEADGKNDLERCVVAGACTVPMLELYQHSCRELKNYISEGRSIVKEIETDTYENNPPLFREYMAAPPDVKPIMDNQFKNVKTHARLLSKAMWYEWRMKLLDGLTEGLLKIRQDMEKDHVSLVQEEQIVQPVLPGLIEDHDRLESQVQIAQAQADELADCDQEELKYARESLDELEQDLDAKEKLVHEMQTQLREKENILEDVVTRKQECIEEIKEAEKIRQDCRGWSWSEVATLQANVDALEVACGWNITAATGLALTMTYNRTLQLFFTPSAFLPRKSEVENGAGENSPIGLTYIADIHGNRPQPLTTERRFFLQVMRAQLQCLQQPSTKVQDLLAFVGNSWESACSVADEVTVLGINYITEPTITGDETMAVRSSILLRPMQTKVEVGFEVRIKSGEGVDALRLSVKATARVCYGEALKEKKMGEFLESKIKGVKGRGVWADAVRELEERCLARGKR